MGLTKAQLEALNDSSFPNNNVGAITPEILRNYNDEVILNTVNQDVYTADSASFSSRINSISGSGGNVDTSSLVTTASFNAYTQSTANTIATLATTASVTALSTSITVTNNTQTNLINGKLDTSSFNTFSSSVTNEITAIESFTASISTSVGLLQTFSGSQYKNDSSSFDNRINAITASGGGVSIGTFNSYTASQDFKNTTFATTGSNTFVGNQTINGNVNITGSLTASGLKYPIVDNGEKSFIQTDGAGNLSLQYVDTIFEAFYAGESVPKGTPLYLSGSVGANPIARAADASNPNKMPVTLIANENLTADNTYEGIVLGLIEGIDLTGFTAGQTVYVAEGGGYSTSLPSGSNSITQVLGIVTKGGSGGKGLVLNPGPAQLPGLIEGYVWVGNGSNQPTAVATSSFIEDLSGYTTTASFNAYTQSTNTFTASISTSVGLLQTFSGSEYKSDSASFSSRIDAGGGSIYTGSFAITSSNTFTGNQILSNVGDSQFPLQIISGGIRIDDPNTDWIIWNSSANGGLKRSNIADLELLAQSGSLNIKNDAGRVFISGSTTTEIAGVDFIPFSASLNTRINGIPTINTGSFATTGSNTFIGNQTINGAVQISSSATYDLDITGGFQATAASRISGSNGTVTLGQNAVTVASGSGTNLINTIVARGYISSNSGSSNQIALYSGILPVGGFTSAKAGGGIAVSIGSPGVYYFPIEFQATTAYTDGRVIFNTPISASAGITASNAFINGELYSVTSASFDSRINAGGGGSIYTGSFAITGSNTFIGDQNINGNITASKLLVTDTGTTAIEYQLQSTGSVMGVYNTSYGKDNIKVYQYQGQPYAFNVNLTANQINAYTGSEFNWGLQLNGSNVSLPGGGGTYFSMASGSTTGSGGVGQDKLGLDYLGTSMILDMNADTSFRRKVYVDKGMYVSQSQGGSTPALIVNGTNAGNSAIQATGSVNITGSLTLNGNSVGSIGYGSLTATAISSSGKLTSYSLDLSSGVEVVSGSRVRVTQNGTYQVSSQINWDSGGSNNDVSMELLKNGTGIAATKNSIWFSASDQFGGTSTSAIVQLNANEYIEIGVSNGTATIDNNNARVSIVKIA
jgi:hypothetical protein